MPCENGLPFAQYKPPMADPDMTVEELVEEVHEMCQGILATPPRFIPQLDRETLMEAADRARDRDYRPGDLYDCPTRWNKVRNAHAHTVAATGLEDETARNNEFQLAIEEMNEGGGNP